MKEEVSKVAEELADETYRLVVDKLKAVDILDNRIKRLEGRMGTHAGAFKTDIVEVERMVTEARENLENEQDESVTMLVGEIQDLRDEVNALKIEVSRLKEQRKF